MTTLPVDAPAVVSLTHLDEDWDVPCEVGGGRADTISCGGENPAVFILWPAACCPAKVAPILSCKRCLDEILDGGPASPAPSASTSTCPPRPRSA